MSCFLSILFSTTIICSNRLYNIFKENYSEVPQFKQIIILGITGLILTFAIRIDLIIEERKFQLRNLKFIYYLIHNLKSKHKFNDKNYKRILIVASTMELFMVKFVVFTIVTVTLLHFLSCVIHEIITFNNTLALIIFPLFVIMIIIVQTTFHPGITLLSIMIFYYKSLFDQIYQRIYFMFKLNFISSIEFNKIINEHNLIAIEVHKLNLFIRRLVAVYFIASSLFKIMFLYLSIHSKEFMHQISWGYLFLIYNFLGFFISYGMQLQTKSGHKSYKLIYSFLATKRMNLSMKLKVINLSLLKFN